MLHARHPTKEARNKDIYGTGTPYDKGVSRFHEALLLFWSEFLRRPLKNIDTTIYYPQKSHRPSSEVCASDHGTKVRISEDNTKQKAKFLHKL